MGRKRHTPEEIIGKLREAEVGLAKGQTIPQGYRTLGADRPDRETVWHLAGRSKRAAPVSRAPVGALAGGARHDGTVQRHHMEGASERCEGPWRATGRRTPHLSAEPGPALTRSH